MFDSLLGLGLLRGGVYYVLIPYCLEMLAIEMFTARSHTHLLA